MRIRTQRSVIEAHIFTQGKTRSQLPISDETDFAFDQLHDVGEILTGVSMTIPDQAMSVRRILDLSRRGLDPGVNVNTPVYHQDDNGDPVLLPDLRKLDLAERQALLEEAKTRVADIRAELNRIELEAQKAKAEAVAKANAEKAAQQGSPVQRTTGDTGQSSTTDQPA